MIGKFTSRLLLSLTLVFSGLFIPSTGAQAAECTAYEQSHPNFLLDGSHMSTGKCSTCASCHMAGVFLGTPKNCVACHDGAGNTKYSTVGRSALHIPTQVIECEQCHFTSSFTTTWKMNHAAVGAQRCDTCHNGQYLNYNATAKIQNHPVTTADCITCHTGVTPPVGSGFDPKMWQLDHATIHAGITTGCVSCHDGVIAKGKSFYVAGHPVTSDQCETCHSINAAFKCASLDDFLKNYAFKGYRSVPTLA